jgi:hypothetical protein
MSRVVRTPPCYAPPAHPSRSGACVPARTSAPVMAYRCPGPPGLPWPAWSWPPCRRSSQRVAGATTRTRRTRPRRCAGRAGSGPVRWSSMRPATRADAAQRRAADADLDVLRIRARCRPTAIAGAHSRHAPRWRSGAIHIFTLRSDGSCARLLAGRRPVWNVQRQAPLSMTSARLDRPARRARLLFSCRAPAAACETKSISGCPVRNLRSIAQREAQAAAHDADLCRCRPEHVAPEGPIPRTSRGQTIKRPDRRCGNRASDLHFLVAGAGFEPATSGL